MLEKLTDTQKLIGLLLVILVLYILYMMYKTCREIENFTAHTSKHDIEDTTSMGGMNNSNTVRIMNTPNVKLSADSLHQPALCPTNTHVDKAKCIVTSGSEFVGIPHTIYEANGGDSKSDYTNADINNTSANGLGYNKISRGTRCGSVQYPPPFKITTKEDDDRMNEEDLDGTKYVSSGYTAFNGLSDSGNVCLTEDQRNFIAGRGGNANSPNYTNNFVKYDANACPA